MSTPPDDEPTEFSADEKTEAGGAPEPTSVPEPEPVEAAASAPEPEPEPEPEAASDGAEVIEAAPDTEPTPNVEAAPEVVEPTPDAEPEGDPPPDAHGHLTSILESLLFAADKPLALKQLGELLGAIDLGPISAAVADLEAMYQTRGVQLHQVAGGWQFRTNPTNATWVQKLLATKPVRLTRAQLETLSICAYRQPITRPEIDDIRGVDSGAALKTLMDRTLIRILGKKEEVGRPLLYGTTREFLDFFSLRDLKDLPTLREFHELTEEHRAQVAALEEKAPAGSVESPEEAAAAAEAEALRRPLERVTYQAPPEDADELAEIDRLISTAGGDKEVILDPSAVAAPDKPQPESE